MFLTKSPKNGWHPSDFFCYQQFYHFILVKGILTYFGLERERESVCVTKVREMGRKGVGFDILFWGIDEEMDVIRLREYNLFSFFNYNRIFFIV